LDSFSLPGKSAVTSQERRLSSNETNTVTLSVRTADPLRSGWSVLQDIGRLHVGCLAIADFAATAAAHPHGIFFQFVHNARRRGKALLGALVAALVA
jgi:hypothetical protein